MSIWMDVLKWKFPAVFICKHYIAPRTLWHFAHVPFSRVWLKIESQTQCEANFVPSKQMFSRPRATRLIRTRHGLIFHLFHFLDVSTLYFNHLAVTNTDLIHAQQDGLVDWPYKVRSHHQLIARFRLETVRKCVRDLEGSDEEKMNNCLSEFTRRRLRDVCSVLLSPAPFCGCHRMCASPLI